MFGFRKSDLMTRAMSVQQKFYRKFFVHPKTRCWIWGGGRNLYGYGRVDFRGFVTPQSAHRLSWALHYGEIPEGMFVLHRCDNPPCVNPEHLFLGTPLDNVVDMQARHGGMYPKLGVS